MAGLYLGLTKMAVDGTLSLVKSTVEEEKKLRENVQKDLVFITGEFEVMRSFLRIASAEHEVELTRMRQLRNLAFDVEDCVEYVVHLDLDKSSFLVWLQRFWQTVNFCRKPWLPLDVAVAEIKQLRARVEDVSQRNTRYSNLIRNSSNIQQAVPPDSALPPSPPLFPMLRDAWETSGKWSHSMCNLKEMIILREGDDDLHVISVWASTGGGGGDDLGMASIFRQAYCDPEICQKFKRCAWVKLTHPFNHHEFVKSLMAQFCVTSHQPNAEFTELNLMRAKKALRKQMRRHKYLLILEDVLTVAEWDIIRAYLPDNKKGSRIIMSTTELGIARFCTGEPYQVSELRHFSDGQFLCAFFKKMQSTMDYLKSQLRCHGVVISVWGFFDNRYYKAYLIDILYKGIINQLKEFGGIKFGRHSWVDVPDEFDLEVFAQRLFLNFYSDNDFRAREIRKVGKKGLQGIIERCRRFLFEEDCLVVIYGVRSKNVWNKIKRTFLLSSSEPSSRTTKGCILVVTDEQDVARYCIKNQEYQTPLNVKDLDADTAVATLRNKGTWYCGLGGNKKGRLFYDRPKDDASEWHGKFGNHSNYAFSLLQGQSGLITVSGNTADIGLQVLLRSAYYCAARRSWVDVSPSESDFDLTDFLWRLLLDFCSDDPYDPQRKEAVAVTLMRGNINIDPIAKCRREFLQVESAQHLVVVIHGVHSTEHWDLIRAKLLSQGFHGTIIVSATDNSLLTYCNPIRIEDWQVPNVDAPIRKEYDSLFFYERQRNPREEYSRLAVGRSKDACTLQHLVQSLRVRVVSVWGIAGVGKSYLVTTVYCHKEISEYYDRFGLVDVPDPFNLTQLCCRLLLDICSHDPQAKETVAVGMMEGSLDPIQECCKILHGYYRCLIVIDGLRSKQDWDLIKANLLLPEPSLRATIIVITSAEEVAIHCVQNDQEKVVNIRRLQADSALQLLATKAASTGVVLTYEEMEILKYTVAKCGGLPKVITAVGEACHPHLRRLRSSFGTYCMWPPGDDFIRDLETKPEFHGLKPLFSWMQSYFDACSDSIKPCIFYLSIFCAEKNIRRRRLLWRWVAEGYCRDTSGVTCEENGLKYISELISLSIIQESPSKTVFCQVNGFFHEYIISRPMEDNLVFALEGCCSLNSQRGGQHLAIRSSWDRNQIVYESIDFSRLRSLTVAGKWEPFFISSKNINMRLLRVLDLEDATDVTNDDLEQIGKLRRLKFLSLRGCREITRLPSSIGGLRQLQTLDVRDTCVVTLPPVITKLQKLQYIRAGTTTTEVWDWNEGNGEDRESSPPQVATAIQDEEHGEECSRARTFASSLLSKLCRRGGLDSNGGVKAPAGIGKLVVLHTLGVVKVNAQCSKDMDIFEELKKLTQLRKLGVSGINKGNFRQFCEAISGHAHLRSLSVEVDKDGGNLDGLVEDDIANHKLPKTIKSLKLYGHVNKLLYWTGQLPNPEKLKIDMTVANLREFGAAPVSTRRLVDHLRIRPTQDGNLHFRDSHWATFARVVEIQCSSVLHITFHHECDDAWSEVQVLKVHFSGPGSQSSLKISGLENLEFLEEVWLKGYTDTHKQDMERQIYEMLPDENQVKPVLKLVQPRSP